MTYPCPMCHADAQKRLDEAPQPIPMPILTISLMARLNDEVYLTTFTTPRERAEHLADVHGWKVR